MSSTTFSAGQKRPSSDPPSESRPFKLQRVGLSREDPIVIQDDDDEDAPVNFNFGANSRGGTSQRVERWVDQVPEDAGDGDTASVIEVDPLDVAPVAVGEDLAGQEPIVAPAQMANVAVIEINGAGWQARFQVQQGAQYVYNGEAYVGYAQGYDGEQQADGYFWNGDAYGAYAQDVDEGQQAGDYLYNGEGYGVHAQGVDGNDHPFDYQQQQQFDFGHDVDVDDDDHDHFVIENRYGGLPIHLDHGLHPADLDMVPPQQLPHVDLGMKPADPAFPVGFPFENDDDSDDIFVGARNVNGHQGDFLPLAQGQAYPDVQVDFVLYGEGAGLVWPGADHYGEAGYYAPSP